MGERGKKRAVKLVVMERRKEKRERQKGAMDGFMLGKEPPRSIY